MVATLIFHERAMNRKSTAQTITCTVVVPRHLHGMIKQLAGAEQRAWSRQALVLLQEALKHREAA